MQFKRVGIVLATIFTALAVAAILMPVYYRPIMHRSPLRSGSPIALFVRMRLGQDTLDPRVITITFTNKISEEIRLANTVGRVFQNFDFQVKDRQGHTAPFTTAALKTLAERNILPYESETQLALIRPGESRSYRFDLTQIADLSNLTGKQIEVTAIYRPQLRYSGSIAASATIIRPKQTAASPPQMVEPIHIP